MDGPLIDLLAALHRHGVEHDAARPDRLDRLRNLEPESARLLALLVRLAGARSLLELGTSNGYSTLWLADAVRATGGRMLSVELEAERSEQAAANLVRAGLRDRVELRVADAGEVLQAAADASFDVIFLDAERPAYGGYWPDLRRALAPAGLLAVDNVISHAGEVAELRALVDRSPGVFQSLVPVGAGLLLVVRETTGERGRAG